MFALGSAVALVTMSVSVALTILVPLVAKKMVRQEYVLPYIMGANITTLGDTMLAAFALDSPAAVRVVLAEVIAAGSLSILLLALAYPPGGARSEHADRDHAQPAEARGLHVQRVPHPGADDRARGPFRLTGAPPPRGRA